VGGAGSSLRALASNGGPVGLAQFFRVHTLSTYKKPWDRIRARAGLEDVRLHDLRHSYASVGATSGLSLLFVGKLLGHTQASTTQRYAHLAEDL
jgi:integrase